MIIISVLLSLWIFPKSFLFLLFPFNYKSDIFQGTNLKRIIRWRVKSKSSPKCTIHLLYTHKTFHCPFPSPHNINTVAFWPGPESGWGSQGEKWALRRSWPSALHRVAWLERAPEVTTIWDPHHVHISPCKDPSSQAARWFWVTVHRRFHYRIQDGIYYVTPYMR